MRRLGLFLFVLLLPLLARAVPAHAALTADEWKKVDAQFHQLYVSEAGKSGYPGKRGFGTDKATLVEQLLKDGEGRSWKMLADVLSCESVLWVDAQKDVRKKEDELFPLLRKVGLTEADSAALTKAQKELADAEQAAKYERDVLDGVVKAVTGAPPALRANLFARAKGPSDPSFRAAVAQLAAAQPTEKEASAFLVRTLNPTVEKDATVRAAALQGLKSMPEGAEDHVIGRLGDPDWTVQILAVRIVREKKVTRAIPTLIAALEKANPRMQDEIGGTLKELTGQNFDPYADVWAKWWADNKEKFQSQEAVKVGGAPKPPPSDAKVYGVPIKSDRVLFILDISGSMRDPGRNPQPNTPKVAAPVTPKEGEKPPPPPPPPEEMLQGGPTVPKIRIALHELKKALTKLPKTAKFALIAFNHAAIPWKETPVDATPANKEEAKKWLEQFDWEPDTDYEKSPRTHGHCPLKGGSGPSGSTFTDGALRVAFRIAGLGAIDKAYDVAIDTMMLISDGAPTDNDVNASKLVDFHPILEHVREWNKEKRVVINCIAVDMQPGNEFMQTLAKENGGVFVDR